MGSITHERICYAHGSNLATAIQVLRNANGQLVPHTRLLELGIERRTGEGMVSRGAPRDSHALVASANINISCGLRVGHHYAQVEVGHAEFYYGMPQRYVLSAAANIPVVMIGEKVDPVGIGAAQNERFVWASAWREGGGSLRRRGAAGSKPLAASEWSAIADDGASRAFHMHSERVNVRVLLVWDPEGAGRDELYCKITQHLVQLIAAEQRLHYHDLHVGLLKEEGAACMALVEAHERAGTVATLSADDINACLFQRPSKPIEPIAWFDRIPDSEVLAVRSGESEPPDVHVELKGTSGKLP